MAGGQFEVVLLILSASSPQLIDSPGIAPRIPERHTKGSDTIYVTNFAVLMSLIGDCINHHGPSPLLRYLARASPRPLRKKAGQVSHVTHRKREWAVSTTAAEETGAKSCTSFRDKLSTARR